MKTRKTKKRNIIRRAVAFLLCMTMVLGLGMQDVIEQVYAEGLSAVSQEQSAPETQNVESTAPTTPEEETDPTASGEIVPVTPEEEPTAPEEDKEPTEPSNPADTEENTDVTTPPTETTEPSAPAEPTTSADGTENTEPAEPEVPETPDSSNDSESSDETTSGEGTGTDEQKPPVEEEPVDSTETTGDEEIPEEELPEEEKPYEAELSVGNVTIHVSADAGVLPEDAELSVTPVVKTEITDDMSEEDKQAAEDVNALYEQTEQKLLEELGTDADDEADTADSETGISILSADEAASEPDTTDEKVLEGFLAYDISFLVEDEEGNESEIEPEGEVKVTFEFAEAVIPEEVSEDAEVSVAHMKESSNENGETEIAVENLAETATVETTDKAEVTKVELSTESFSVFTIYWSKESNKQSLQIQVVDQNGDPIGDASMIRFEDGTEKTVKEIASEIVVPAGYSFDRAEMNGGEIARLRYSNGRNQYSTSENGDQWNNVGYGNTIYFYFEEIDAIINIVDHIKTTGLLDIEVEPEFEEEIQKILTAGGEYVWYSSENGGEYTEVELKKEGDDYNIRGDHGEQFDIVIDGADKANKTKYMVRLFAEGNDDPVAQSAEFVVPYYRDIQNGGFEDVLSDGAMTYTDHQPTNGSTQWSNENYAYWGGVWQTTGLGAYNNNTNQDIEILNAETEGGQGSGDGFMYHHTGRWDNDSIDENAADGEQFAEINCETSGALYQDVLTNTKIDLEYYLSHRARSRDYQERGNREEHNTYAKDKYDTMYLVIMPTSQAEGYANHTELVNDLNGLLGEDEIPTGSVKNNRTQEEAKVIYNQDGVLIARITSNASDWHLISSADIATEEGLQKTYQPISSLTRFFFISGATFAGNATDVHGNTIGNLVDAISFGQGTVAPSVGKVNIEIEKTVTGLSADKLDELKGQLSFEIIAKDPDSGEVVEDAPLNGMNIQASEFTWGDPVTDSDGVVTVKGTYLASEKIDLNEIYLYEVVESNEEVGGYTVSSELTVSANELKGNGAVLGEQDGARFSFTNSYTSSLKKDVNFTKIWDDDGNSFGTRPESLTVSLKASVTADGGSTYTLRADELGLESLDKTLNAADAVTGNSNEWRVSWHNLPVYFEYEDETLPINYEVIEGDINSEYVYEAVNVEDASDYQLTDFTGVTAPENSSGAAVNLVSASATAAAADSTGSLGVPEHRKWIDYDAKTDEYTLNLSVTGAKGGAKGVDVLFVIDKSGSMADEEDYWGNIEEGLLSKTKKLLIGTDQTEGIIDQIFDGDDNNLNSVAFIAFSDYYSADNDSSTQWFTAKDKESLESAINRLDADGNTNWTYAMREASDMLESRQNENSVNEKVVIFLSDGAPNRTMKYYGGWYESWNGSTTDFCDDAVDVVTDSDALKSAMIYSVYMNSSAKTMMEYFADEIKAAGYRAQNVDGTGNNLSEALKGILNQIIPEYKNVRIEDTLSRWADFANASESSVKVTKKTSSNGTPEDITSQCNVNITGKKVTVNLLNDAALDANATYTVSFKVKPSQAAIDYQGEYPDTGDPDTGTTSSEQDGFFSNDAAEVYYDIAGGSTNQHDDYPKPVIQRPVPTTTDITVTKVWEDSGNTNQRPPYIEVKLDKYDNETVVSTETATLNAEKGWSYTWENQPLSEDGKNYTYKVEEVDVPDGYTSSVSTVKEEGNLQITVTNAYDPNSVDEEICIANKLQTDKLIVNKTWNDEGYTDSRPESILVQIKDRLNKTCVVELRKDNWNGSITVPRLKNPNYSCTELNLDSNYVMETSVISDNQDGTFTITLTNTLKTISITVKKEWRDGGLVDEHGPVDFEIVNKAGAIVGSGTLSSANEWHQTISGLPAGDDYTVREVNPPAGYNVTEGNFLNQYTLTNTLKWSAMKTDKLLANETEDNRTPLQGAEFELYREELLIATGTSGPDGVITWDITDEAKEEEITSLDNLNGTYKIVETKAPGNYLLNKDGWVVVFDKGVPTTINGKSLKNNVTDEGVVLILENELLYELPSTGGPGIYLYMLGGVALMMAGTLLVYKKRKEEVLRS